MPIARLNFSFFIGMLMDATLHHGLLLVLGY
jgi:hypothetical protein